MMAAGQPPANSPPGDGKSDMAEDSAPGSGSDPVKANPPSRALPSTEGGDHQGADPTIDFQRDQTWPSPQTQAMSSGPLAEYGFLDPPIDSDELGWLAHYRVRRLIGSGGMGLVFQAEDNHLHARLPSRSFAPSWRPLRKPPPALHARPGPPPPSGTTMSSRSTRSVRRRVSYSWRWNTSRGSRSSAGSLGAASPRSTSSCGSAGRLPRVSQPPIN